MHAVTGLVFRHIAQEARNGGGAALPRSRQKEGKYAVLQWLSGPVLGHAGRCRWSAFPWYVPRSASGFLRGVLRYGASPAGEEGEVVMLNDFLFVLLYPFWYVHDAILVHRYLKELGNPDSRSSSRDDTSSGP